MFKDERFEFIGDFSSLKKYKFKEKKDDYVYEDEFVQIYIPKDGGYTYISAEYYIPDDIFIMLYYMIQEGLFNIVKLNKYTLKYKVGKGSGKWWYETFYCKSHDEFINKTLNRYLNSERIYCVEEVQ